MRALSPKRRRMICCVRCRSRSAAVPPLGLDIFMWSRAEAPPAPAKLRPLVSPAPVHMLMRHQHCRIGPCLWAVSAWLSTWVHTSAAVVMVDGQCI